MVKKTQKSAATEKNTAAHLSGTVKESAQQIWLAGLGAFAKAQEEGTKVFDSLVKEGMSIQRKTQAAAEEKISEATNRMANMATDISSKASGQWDKLENIFEDRVSKVLNKLGVPSAKDIDVLVARIDELNRNVSKLNAKAGAAPRSAARWRRQACCQACFGPQVGLRRRAFCMQGASAPFFVFASARFAATQQETQTKAPTLTADENQKFAHTQSRSCARRGRPVGRDLRDRRAVRAGRSTGRPGFHAAAPLCRACPRADSSRPASPMACRHVELCASFIENDDRAGDVFDPSWLMVPAYGEFARRALMFPGLAASALWRGVLGRRSLTHSLERLGPSLPTGIFSNDLIDRRLALLFSRDGRTNDFRELKARLTLVATNLDTGEAAPFGRPGWDHVPISKAVQASSALPGLFPPVEIDAHYFVDGALKKTMHASVALDDGIDLMLCLNPAGALQLDAVAGGQGHAGRIAAREAQHSAHCRRRLARRAEPDLPLDDSFAHGTGHEAL